MIWHNVCVCRVIYYQEARLREQARQLRREEEAALEKLQAAQQDRDMAAEVRALTFLVRTFACVSPAQPRVVTPCLCLCGWLSLWG